MIIRSRLPVLGLALSGLMSVWLTGCSDSTSTAEASLLVGPAGATITITDGPLDGTILEIPAGALAEETLVEIFPVGVVPVSGFASSGRAVEIRPANLVLESAATLTLPFEVPGSTRGNAVLSWDGAGPVVEVGPTELGQNNENVRTAELAITTFRRYWFVLRQFPGESGGGLQVGSDFLPLTDGNLWTFTEDLSVTVNSRSDVPNLEGVFLNELVFTRGDDQFGFYVVRDFVAGLLFVGQFEEIDATRQWVHDEGRFLLQDATVGQVAVETVPGAQRFTPLGSTMVESTGVLTSRSNITRPQVPFFTSLGGFDNLVRLEFSTEYTNADGEVETTDLVIDLQEEFGPVRVEFLGLVAEVVGAERFGLPVDPPLPPPDPPATLTSR